ncbi:MAG TPA: hypothetical protein V6D20_12265 [Candidatus Obscuribacterales bacterium]
MLVSCSSSDRPIAPRAFTIQQAWQLKPGSQIGTYPVVAGLGDISIQLKGDRVYAPFDGQLQPHADSDCLIFSSPEVPAYLLRLCGLHNPRLGAVHQGEAIGTGQLLHFAALRKQPDGTWALVEPASSLIEGLFRDR